MKTLTEAKNDPAVGQLMRGMHVLDSGAVHGRASTIMVFLYDPDGPRFQTGETEGDWRISAKETFWMGLIYIA